MITLIGSLIFYVIDPMLGIIVALVLPSAVALDLTGEYQYVFVSVFLILAFYFVRKVGQETLED